MEFHGKVSDYRTFNGSMRARIHHVSQDLQQRQEDLVRYLFHSWHCRRIDTSDPRKQKAISPQQLSRVQKDPRFNLFEQEPPARSTR